MGTFLIKNEFQVTPTFTAGVGSWVVSGVNRSTWNFQTAPLGTVATIIYNFSNPVIYLDGGIVPFTIATIPVSGFLITGSSGISGSALALPTLFLSGSMSGVNPLHECIHTGTVKFLSLTDSSSYPFTMRITTGGVIIGAPGNRFIPGPLNSSPPSPSLLKMMGLSTFDFRTEITTLVGILSSGTLEHRYDINPTLSGLNYRGDYILWSTQLTLTPANANIGDIITITDGALGLDAITSFNMGSFEILATIFGTRTASQVQLIVPSGIGVGTIGVQGIIPTGTIFLGSFKTPDFSGIYISSPSTKDQFYDRSTTPPTTIGVKIPNPTIRTGFISDEDEGYYG